jgi:ATP-dependent Lon protease
MATALISALTKRPVSRDVAMTGEITLRGRVLPIGGLKEKSLAAFRAGIKTIIIPDRNEKDLDEIPKPLRRKLRWLVAKNMSDVLKVALIERRTSTHKLRLVAPKGRVRVNSRTSKKANRPLRKNQRDRSIPLVP